MREKKYFIFNCIQTYGFFILLIITAGLFNSYIFYDETYTGFYFFITSDKWARNAIPRYPNKNYFNKSERSGVYINAMKQTSFKDTTKDFKEGIIRSLAQFILKMDKQPNTPYNISTIKDKIDSFNLLNLKYQFFVPSGYNTIGNLTINLRDITQYDNGTPIIYNPNHTDEK